MQVTEQLVQEIVKVYGRYNSTDESLIEDMAEQILYLSCCLEELNLQSKADDLSKDAKEPLQKELVPEPPAVEQPVEQAPVVSTSKSHQVQSSRKTFDAQGNEYYSTIYEVIALGLKMPYAKFQQQVKRTLIEQSRGYLVGKFELEVTSNSILGHICKMYEIRIGVHYRTYEVMHGNGDVKSIVRIMYFERDKFMLMSANFGIPREVMSKTRRESLYPVSNIATEKREMFADRLRQADRKRMVDQCRERSRKQFQYIMEPK